MKKTISSALCTIFCLVIITANVCMVSATNGIKYMRVINDTTPFYQDATGQHFTCYLPYTYYVKILGETNGFYHIECYGINQPAIDGYVPTDALFFDGLAVSSPYPNATVTTLETTPLYTDTTTKQSIQYVFKNRELAFYGYALSELGENLLYVAYNGKLGYIKESQVTPFSLPNHPNELTFLTPETPVEEPQTTVENSSVNLRIIIIGILVLAGIIALMIAVKNKPQQIKTQTYYDENDFE